MPSFSEAESSRWAARAAEEKIGSANASDASVERRDKWSLMGWDLGTGCYTRAAAMGTCFWILADATDHPRTIGGGQN